MVFSTMPPHQLRLSYKFTIVFIEEKRLVSLLLLTVVSYTDLPTLNLVSHFMRSLWAIVSL
jgi:hypothetical protein